MQRLILLSALAFLFIAGNPSFHVTLAAARDAAVVNPKIVTVIFENDKVRVLRARYAPHQRLEMHSHPAKAEVQITDGRFQIFTPDAEADVPAVQTVSSFSDPSQSTFSPLRGLRIT